MKRPQVLPPSVSRKGELHVPRRTPRVLPPGLHGELSPTLRELYAQSTGACVETPQGRVPAWSLAAGADLELPGIAVASVANAVPLLAA